MANFETVAGNQPRYSSHNLSYEKKMSANMGILYPVLVEEVVPGDVWQIGNEAVARMQPLVAPVLADIHIYTHYFFVPYRLLWDDWEDFITGGKKGNFSEPIPSVENPDFLKDKSFGDYLGMPPLKQFGNDVGTDGHPENTAFKNLGISLFPWSAYSLIWNKYYRDENLQKETYVKYPNGQSYSGTPDKDELSDFQEYKGELFYRNWKKDYFTSALPWVIRGEAPTVPVGMEGHVSTRELEENLKKPPVINDKDKAKWNSITVSVEGREWIESTGHTLFFVSFEKMAKLSNNFENSELSMFTQPVINKITGGMVETFTLAYAPLRHLNFTPNDWERVYEYMYAIWKAAIAQGLVGRPDVSLSITSSGFTVGDLRLAAQLQKWMELNARAGTQYTTFLHAHFGVSPTDARLNRPEYIGGTKAPLIMSEVLQTSGSVNGGSPQGNMAGHGIGAFNQFVGKFRAEEYGIVIGLMSIIPKGTYMAQGVNRQWTRKTRFDFYSPEFANISEQAIYRQELYASGSDSDNKRVFGYQGRFDEMRVKQDMVCGDMRKATGGFSHWHLARLLPSNVELNEDFVQCKPSKRIFAVPSEDNLIINYSNTVKAIRPMPYVGTPGITSI